MAVPEDIEQIGVADLCRVILHLQGLCSVADAAIGGVFYCTAGVPRTSADDAVEKPEPGIRTPESPHGKGGSTKAYRYGFVHGRTRIRRRPPSAQNQDK